MLPFRECSQNYLDPVPVIGIRQLDCENPLTRIGRADFNQISTFWRPMSIHGL